MAKVPSIWTSGMEKGLLWAFENMQKGVVWHCSPIYALYKSRGAMEHSCVMFGPGKV